MLRFNPVPCDSFAKPITSRPPNYQNATIPPERITMRELAVDVGEQAPDAPRAIIAAERTDRGLEDGTSGQLRPSTWLLSMGPPGPGAFPQSLELVRFPNR